MLTAAGGCATRKPACPKTNMTALTQNAPAPARVRRLAAPERASSMRPASHANLHLINTRGVFAARAACVPICAFCIWRFLRSTATSVFQLVFTDDALFFHGGHAAQISSFVRRLQAVFTRLGLPRAGDTRKNRSGFAGFEMLPAQSPQGHHAMKEGAKKAPAHPAPQRKPGHERPCRALTAAWARFPAPRAGCLTVAAARACGRPGTSWRAAGLLAWRRPCWG